jgi:hypothetical protein
VEDLTAMVVVVVVAEPLTMEDRTIRDDREGDLPKTEVVMAVAVDTAAEVEVVADTAAVAKEAAVSNDNNRGGNDGW